jgi:hypothetical protein
MADPILPKTKEEQQRELGLEPTKSGGVVGAVGDAGEAVGGYFKDMFSADKVVAPTIDESKFQRTPDSAATTGYVDRGSAAGQQGAALAGGQRATGTDVRQAATGIAAGQRAMGEDALNKQGSLAADARGMGVQAANRGGPAALSDADRARSQQFDALGGLKQFQQQGPGPSAAEIQLRQGADQSMGQALALARSGRNGTNPAAERQAMFQNAATTQGLSQQQGLLRAQEEQNFRNQQLQSMGMEQQGLKAVSDAATAAAGVENQSRSVNDQAGLGYLKAGTEADALGYSAGQGFGSLGNQTEGQGQQYDVSMQGIGNQMDLGSAQIEQKYQELAEKARAGDRDAMIELERLKAEQAIAASKSNAEIDAKGDGGIMGAAMGLVGGLFSDERSKTKIRELEGELARTYRALGGPPATAGVRKGNESSASDRALSRDLDEAMGPTFDALGVKRDPDLREAKGYSYEYKDPSRSGTAPGRQYGPMAQDLEKSPATAASVVDTPDGKMVDPGRLTMTNTAAISDQQREADAQQKRIEELEKQVQAMGGKPDDNRNFDGTIYRRFPEARA